MPQSRNAPPVVRRSTQERPLVFLFDQPIVTLKGTPTAPEADPEDKPGGALKIIIGEVQAALRQGRPVIAVGFPKNDVQRGVARLQAEAIARGERPQPFVMHYDGIGNVDVYFVHCDRARYELGRNQIFGTTMWTWLAELLGTEFEHPFDPRAWSAFEDNSRLAAELLAVVAPYGADVVVHDHQLPFVGAHLGPARHDLTLAFFGHTWFPSWQYVSSLTGPSAVPPAQLRMLMEAYAAYDGTVMQSAVPAQNLLDILLKMGIDPPVIGTALVNMDADYVLSSAQAPDAKRMIAELEAWVDGRFIVMEGSRADPYKNFGLLLEANDYLLSTGLWTAATHGGLVVPGVTRASIPMYDSHSEDIADKVTYLQQRFGAQAVKSLGGAYINMLAALTVTTGAIVTPAVRDGCNLINVEGALLNRHNAAHIMNKPTGINTRFAPLLADEEWNPLVISTDIRSVAWRYDRHAHRFDADPSDVRRLVSALLAAEAMDPADRARMARTHANAALFDSPERHLEQTLAPARRGAAIRSGVVDDSAPHTYSLPKTSTTVHGPHRGAGRDPSRRAPRAS